MSELRQQLDALAAHVRDPDAHAGPPGIEARRLKIYRDLVYNNLDGLLAGNFPVIRKTLDDADFFLVTQGQILNAFAGIQFHELTQVRDGLAFHVGIKGRTVIQQSFYRHIVVVEHFARQIADFPGDLDPIGDGVFAEDADLA